MLDHSDAETGNLQPKVKYTTTSSSRVAACTQYFAPSRGIHTCHGMSGVEYEALAGQCLCNILRLCTIELKIVTVTRQRRPAILLIRSKQKLKEKRTNALPQIFRTKVHHRDVYRVPISIRDKHKRNFPLSSDEPGSSSLYTW